MGPVSLDPVNRDAAFRGAPLYEEGAMCQGCGEEAPLDGRGEPIWPASLDEVMPAWLGEVRRYPPPLPRGEAWDFVGVHVHSGEPPPPRPDPPNYVTVRATLPVRFPLDGELLPEGDILRRTLHERLNLPPAEKAQRRYDPGWLASRLQRGRQEVDTLQYEYAAWRDEQGLNRHIPRVGCGFISLRRTFEWRYQRTLSLLVARRPPSPGCSPRRCAHSARWVLTARSRRPHPRGSDRPRCGGR